MKKNRKDKRDDNQSEKQSIGQNIRVSWLVTSLFSESRANNRPKQLQEWPHSRHPVQLANRRSSQS